MGNKKQTKEAVVEEVTEETTEETAPVEEVVQAEETTEEVSTEVPTEVPTEETTEETTEEVIEKCDVTAHGVVTADRLNVRKEADKDADVVTIISKGTEVEVNLTKSTDDFYCVSVLANNNFVDAYCVKKFIEIK